MLSPLLKAARAFLVIVPRPICELVLQLVRHVPTRFGIALRYIFISRLSASCGDNVAIFEGVYLFKLENMHIGDNVSIHQMCYIDATGGLTIGSDVAIAHGTTIMTSDHVYSSNYLKTRDAECVLASVAIQDDVWIGAGVRILSGVIVHAQSVVAAGAVVTKDVPQSSLMAGVPARVLKEISRGRHETPAPVRS